MTRVINLFKDYWLTLLILIYVVILFLSILIDNIYFSLSNILLLLLGLIAVFVASSLEKLKVILFLGKNINTVSKAQALLLFFAGIIIYLSLKNLDMLKSLSRWD